MQIICTNANLAKIFESDKKCLSLESIMPVADQPTRIFFFFATRLEGFQGLTVCFTASLVAGVRVVGKSSTDNFFIGAA